jgi:hypothetical protein
MIVERRPVVQPQWRTHMVSMNCLSGASFGTEIEYQAVLANDEQSQSVIRCCIALIADPEVIVVGTM